jgi:cytoskeleton protein RodZ
VFEIGNSLREARLRRGVDFAQAEVATKIRGKYLRALEDEQFELLPAQTYVKGFLRTYAEYLGLDGQLYVDEFNSRFVAGDEHDPRPRRSTARPQHRNRRSEANLVLIAIAAIVVLTVIVFSAWRWSGGGSGSPGAPATVAKTKTHQPPAPLLEVTGLRGSTQLTVHAGSAAGAVKFDGTVQQGDAPRAIRGSRLWVSISTPENLEIRVRGVLVHVPGSQPRVIIVTPTGWRPA